MNDHRRTDDAIPARDRVRLDVTDRVARITLDAPEQHNALGAEDVHAFRSHLDHLEEDGSSRVLVVGGTGPDTFCAGASLPELASGQMTGELFETLTDRLAAVRLPTICALNGSAYGGGAELALCCDFRIGVTGSRLRVPAARLGVCYPVGGLERYVRRLGPSVAKRILVAGDELDAAEMLRVGFLTRLVEPSELAGVTDALADRLAGQAPLAVRAMKRILDAVEAGSLDAAEARALVEACEASDDRREGLEAQRQGREPVFRGR
jgi:enoyl-CoA hydratase/carnithine racemase